MIIKPCPHFKDEKSFTTWYLKQIKDQWWFAHKISDMDTRLKPFDAFYILNGIATFVEFKMWDEKKKCDVYAKLRPNQIYWLRHTAAAWWNAKVIYYNRIYDIYVVMNFEVDTTSLIRAKIL